MKATIISTGANYTVSLENGQKGLHPQPKSEISKEKYQRLLVKNYGYDFLIDKIDQVLSTIEDDFDPNLNTLEPSTGEVTPVITAEHPQEPFINPLKPEQMETPKTKTSKGKPALDAEIIKEPKHSVLAKSRGVSARLAEAGIRGAGVVGCTFFYGIADAAKLAGDLWSEGAAAAIKPLGTHPDSTRQEIAASIRLTADKTLAKTYTAPMIAYSAITRSKAVVDKAVENVNLNTATV